MNEDATALAELLGARDPAPEVFDALVDGRIEELGLLRPSADEGDAPAALLYWLLSMAKATYRRRREPLPVPPGVGTLGTLLRRRPAPDAEYAQMHIDAASVLRRASVVEREPVVLVGDDDGLSAALQVRGRRDVHIVDLDDRLLEALGGFGPTYRCDVFRDPPPDELQELAGTAVVDPIRSFDGCLAFLDFAAQCLRPGGTLLLADHPDWNYELPLVLKALAGFELRLVAVRELWHEYPLTATWRPELASRAAACGVDRSWLEKLADRVSGWSHLYVLERDA